MGWEKGGGEARGVGPVSPGRSYASYPQSHLISLEIISNRLNTPGTVCPLDDHSTVPHFCVPCFYSSLLTVWLDLQSTFTSYCFIDTLYGPEETSDRKTG